MAKWDRRLTLVTFEIRMGSSPALSASPENAEMIVDALCVNEPLLSPLFSMQTGV